MVQWGDRYRYFFLKDAALRRLRFKFFIAKVKRSCRERNSSISKGSTMAPLRLTALCVYCSCVQSEVNDRLE
jgi:hypothetical protein